MTETKRSVSRPSAATELLCCMVELTDWQDVDCFSEDFVIVLHQA